MKINKISYRNFKSNVCETIFDFSSNKNLNVVKGENGCGKTSLIEAISLAFFGRQIFNSNNFTNDYIKFVTSRLSNNSDDSIILIEVLFTDEGKDYKLVRTFDVNDSFLNSDNLTIYHNDQKVESCPFIQKFNFEIVKRFFLDGEKIIELINSNKIIPFINEFIDAAFNLKTMKQIKSDLISLQRKEFKKVQNTKHKHFENTVLKQEKRLLEVINEINDLKDKIVTFESNVNLLQKEIEKQGFISKSDVSIHINKKDELLLKRKDLNDQLKQFLINDIEYLMHRDVLKKCVLDLEKTRKDRLKSVISAYSSLDSKSAFELQDTISLKLEYYICNKYSYVNNIETSNINGLLTSIKNNQIQITKVTNKLRKTEDGQKRLDVLDEHESSIILLKEYKEQLIKQQDYYKELEVEFINNKKELDKLNDELLRNSIDANSLNEQEKLNRVLDKYIKRRREDLNYELSNKCTLLLNKYFLRKKDLIDGVKITNDSIDVYMNNELVNYNNFSSGEKQMLIVGLIFTIIEFSNLQTPLFLDSFVGRLDKKHTENILKYLIDYNKCQTILLVTDEEFSKKRYDDLKDNIGSIYSLFNEGYSAVAKEGYYED